MHCAVFNFSKKAVTTKAVPLLFKFKHDKIFFRIAAILQFMHSFPFIWLGTRRARYCWPYSYAISKRRCKAKCLQTPRQHVY